MSFYVDITIGYTTQIPSPYYHVYVSGNNEDSLYIINAYEVEKLKYYGHDIGKIKKIIIYYCSISTCINNGLNLFQDTLDRFMEDPMYLGHFKSNIKEVKMIKPSMEELEEVFN